MLVLGIGVGLLALAMTALPLCAVLVARHSVSAAADAAALAAADAVSGFAPGDPCGRAARASTANGAILSFCEVDGLVVTVSVSRSIGGFTVSQRATAGPPGSGVD